MTIDKKSWGYRADARLEDFMTLRDLIRGIIIHLSAITLPIKCDALEFGCYLIFLLRNGNHCKHRWKYFD